jgi:hypothetical protein
VLAESIQIIHENADVDGVGVINRVVGLKFRMDSQFLIPEGEYCRTRDRELVKADLLVKLRRLALVFCDECDVNYLCKVE